MTAQEPLSIFMISCRRASRLMSDELDRPLRRRERVALALHLAMCRACSRCRRQLGFLRRAARRLGGGDDTV